MVGEFDHMGTNPGGFRIFGSGVVGTHNVGSRFWVVDPRSVGVVVLSWAGLGKSRLPAWVVWGDMAEGFGNPVGSSSDETEPDVTFVAFGSERGSRGRVGPDPDPISHPARGRHPASGPTRIRSGNASTAASSTSTRSET